MLFNSLLKREKSLFWTLYHVGLAFVSTITPFALVLWFYLIFFANIRSATFRLARGVYFPFVSLLFYTVSFELLGRMARCSPFIPAEVGKYFLIIFFSLGILLKGIRSSRGIWMLLLLLPAFFYDYSGERTFTDIVFNTFGPLSLTLGVIMLYRVSINQEQLNSIIHLIWFTCVAALFFTFIKTPDLESVNFTLRAKSITTGGTPSNQVATILGLGMFFSFYALLNRLKFSGYFIGDLFIFLLFSFQGLISFSRGGMLTAAVGMVILFFYSGRAADYRINRLKYLFIGVAAIIGVFSIFQIADNITGGNLLLRYSGETQTTLTGVKEKTADVVMSGRLTIMTEDLQVWEQSPILGVGAGASRYLRDKTNLFLSHVELTRLIADHGIPGILYFILLLASFFAAYIRLPNNSNRGMQLALFSIALLTTFHAAMRTYVSPLLFVLSTFYITGSSLYNRK